VWHIQPDELRNPVIEPLIAIIEKLNEVIALPNDLDF